MLKRIIEYETHILISLIVFALLLRIQFVRSFNLNWDEFFFLEKVHNYLTGDLTDRLQSIHVHVFTWLTTVSGNEADQIVAARFVMLVLHGLTAFFLYRIATRVTDRSSGLFAALAYLCFSYVIRGGGEFSNRPYCDLFYSCCF